MDSFAKLLGVQSTNVVTEQGANGQFRMVATSKTCPPIEFSDEDTDSGSESERSSNIQRKHIYRPLKPNEIRMLILNPGKPDEPIECFLEHHPVRAAKSYFALSYVWGDPSSTGLIRLDGCEFSVTSNLRTFLHSLRKEKVCYILWVDALCINQHDVAERNKQIRLMKQVYEGASQVLIWLGDPIEQTEAAANFLRQTYPDKGARTGEQTSKGTSDEVDADAALEFQNKSNGQLTKAIEIENVAPDVLEGLQDLFSRPWWNRIWVYQEATAPARHDSIMFCGPSVFYFSKLLRCNRELLGTRTAMIMDEYSGLRRSYHRTGTSDYLRLADLLPTLRGFNSTNPRDKVYALIPTSIDGGDLIDVDYSLSVEDVYIDAACNILESDGNLNFLGYCTERRADSALQLPSWVPDWTVKVGAHHFYKRADQSPLYTACAKMTGHIHVDRERRELKCKGLTFDVVDKITQSSGELLKGSELVESWIDWLSTIEFQTSTPSSSYEKPIREILLRTVVADCVRSGMGMGKRISAEADVNEAVTGASLEDSLTRFRGVHPAFLHRRLIITRKGYLGIAAEHVLPGDLVTILEGGLVPIVLRGTEDRCSLVGEAYIHGIMDGEAVDMTDNNISAFTIV